MRWLFSWYPQKTNNWNLKITPKREHHLKQTCIFWGSKMGRVLPPLQLPFLPMNFRESIGRFSSAPYLEVMVDVKRPSIDKTLIEFDQPNSQAQAFGGGGLGRPWKMRIRSPNWTLWKWAFNWAVLKGHDWNVFVFIVLVGKNSC